MEGDAEVKILLLVSVRCTVPTIRGAFVTLSTKVISYEESG